MKKKTYTVSKSKKSKISRPKNKFQHLVENLNDLVCEIDRNGCFTYLSPQYKTLMGYEPGELLGTHASDIGFKDQIPVEAEKLNEMIKTGQPSRETWRFRHKNGEWRWMECSASVYEKKSGDIGIIVISRDITEQKETERELKASQERFSTLFRSSPVCTSLARLSDGKIYDVNEAFLNLFGFQYDEVIGRTPLEIDLWVDPEDRENMVRTLKEKGVTPGFETVLRAKNGGKKNALVISELVELGGELYIMGLSMDITQRKQIEQIQLKEISRDKLLLMLHKHAPDWTEREIYLFALQEALVISDSSTGSIYKVHPDRETVTLIASLPEVPGQNQLASHLNLPIHEAGIWAGCAVSKQAVVYNDSRGLSAIKTYPPGHPHLTRYLSLPVLEGDQVRLVMGVGNKMSDYDEIDVTHLQIIANELYTIIDRKQAEEDIRHMSSFPRLNPNPIIEVNWDGQIVYANEAVQKILADVGLHDPRAIYPDDMDEIIENFRDGSAMSCYREVKIGNSTLGEYIYSVSEFNTIRVYTIDISKRKWAEDLIDAQNEQMQAQFEELQSQDEELKQAYKNLNQLNADLEERVEQRTEALTQANAEMEAFSYSVSHDLRSPLRAINGFGQLLLEEYSDNLDETGKNYIQTIRSSSAKMGHLIDDLLKLSRINRKEINIERVDLSQIVCQIRADLETSSKERQAAWKIKADITAEGDKGLLYEALENLLSNAWKFTSRQEEPVIEFGSFQQDHQLVYFVRDNGAGFDSNLSDKLFEPFTRMHSDKDFEGTGIGLSIVKRIVTHHGGKIWAEGEAGRGATFYFTLGDHGQDRQVLKPL